MVLVNELVGIVSKLWRVKELPKVGRSLRAAFSKHSTDPQKNLD